MTQINTPNMQNQGKPNHLAAMDKKVADDSAAEQRLGLQAPDEKQMQAQADGKQQPHGSDDPAPAQQDSDGATKN